MNKYDTHPNWLANHRIYRPSPTNPVVLTHCTWHECKGYFVYKSIEGTVSEHFPSCSNSEWFFIYSYPFKTPISLLDWLNLHDIVKLLSEKENKNSFFFTAFWPENVKFDISGLGIRQSTLRSLPHLPHTSKGLSPTVYLERLSRRQLQLMLYITLRKVYVIYEIGYFNRRCCPAAFFSCFKIA